MIIGNKSPFDDPCTPILQEIRRYRTSRSKGPFKSSHIQTGDNLKASGELLLQHYGSACGMLTITSTGMAATEVRERCSRLMKRIKEHFPAYLGVLAPNGRSYPHLHMLIACTQDIREGFDPVAYEELKELSHYAAEHQFRMSREVTKRMLQNPFLKSLWDILEKEIIKAGLGPRFWLIPILDASTPGVPNQYSPEIAVKYLIKNYFDGVRANHRSKQKKLRICSRSKGFPWPPRPKPDPESLWQRQADAVSLALGLPRDKFTNEFGPKWGLWFTRIFDDISVYNNPPPDGWPTVNIVETVFQYLQPRTKYFCDLKWHIFNNLQEWRRTCRDHHGKLVGQGRWDNLVPMETQVPPPEIPAIPLSRPPEAIS